MPKRAFFGNIALLCKAMKYLTYICLMGLFPALYYPLCAQEDSSVESSEEPDSEEGEEKKDQGPMATGANAAKLIEYHLQVLGGLEQIKSIRTLAIKGPLKEGKNNFNMIWYRKAPNKYRVEQHYRKLGRDYRTIRVYDGRAAWTQVVKPKPPAVMGKAEARDFALEADFYGPLVDHPTKGHFFVYDSQAKVYGKPTHIVKGRLNTGAIVYYYFDVQDYLLRRYGFTGKFASSKVNADYYPKGFRKFNGVVMELGREYVANKGIYKEVDFESIKVNVEISDALFTMPKSKELWLRQKGK